MAKLSAIQKNIKRHKLVNKYSSKRAKLKKICCDKTISIEDRFNDITLPPKVIGIPDERNIRKSFTKKERAPVITKSTKSDQVEICIKVPFGKTRKFAQTAFNVNELDKQTFITKMSALHEKIMPIPDLNMAQLK